MSPFLKLAVAGLALTLLAAFVVLEIMAANLGGMPL